MNGGLPLADFRQRLDRDCAEATDFPDREPRATEELVRGLVAKRRSFGITRLGSLTRLDRAGVAVAQAVRPLSLSNAVSQGKGLDIVEAAASALMEALESWAAERIPATRITTATAQDLGEEVRDLYADCRVHGFDAGWDQLPLGWTDGYDLFTSRIVPVPTALVDTVYTYPSPHPVAFPRSTTGLAAGRTLLAAIVHAALEVLERASLAEAKLRPRSLAERPVDVASVRAAASSQVLARLREADLIAGIWLVPAEHGLPVFRCHVIEGESHREIAPMPGEGFGCDFTHDRALAKALMEAAQARVTALAGAREDITRLAYPERYDRERLAEWRDSFLSPRSALALSFDDVAPSSGKSALGAALNALRRAGAGAALVVPLHNGSDPAVEVVRLVAPPLRDLVGD